MKYLCTLLAVKDIEKSKKFYQEVLGLEITEDFGANVTLSGRIALQTIDTWKNFIHKNNEEINFGNNVTEIYFEENDLDSFIKKLKTFTDIEYVHPLTEHSWGQRVIRFYDPDKHIIEVGENMIMVVKRFLDSGLSAHETAKRMDVPIEFINYCISKI